MSSESGRATVAEIDLSALRFNYRTLAALAPGRELMAVVKADAYGHGAVTVSRTLAADECRHFGVATIGEARELREAGVERERIYLLGGFFAEQTREIVDLGITPFVFDVSLIAPLDAAARAAGRSAFPIHLKFDTGATRLGIMPDDIPAAIAAMRAATSLRFEGACTLLANASDPTSPVTDSQLKVFRAVLAALGAAGLHAQMLHVANTAALVLRADSRFTMVRSGLALYGLPPVPAVRERVELRPVMTFKTRLVQRKRVPAGTGVSYGHTFVTTRPSVIGVLPVGYADGYRRGLQHGAEVLIRGQRARVVGAVCMDLTMIDLTELPQAEVGDEVILWGGKGDSVISVNDVARLAQTISYEMLSTVGKRVPRIVRG
ncbi:MAG: alanine racemase [Candidatus Binataceae bacterium]